VNLEGFHIYHLIFLVVRSWHNIIDKLLDVLSKLWSHAIANRTSQLIIEEVIAINPLNVLRAAVEHEVEMISTTVTRISRLADQTLHGISWLELDKSNTSLRSVEEHGQALEDNIMQYHCE
jgi:hypothetical protein